MTGLKQIMGPFWPMVKNLLSGIKLKIDADARTVTITNRGKESIVMTFEDFEQAFNER